MSATKVKLRKRTLPSGKITLYLDFYPPVRNPKTLELSRREYLGIYLKSNPRTIQDREHYIKGNVNEYLEGISDVETRREYLTLEELRDLADTPCEIPVLKAASLFSCLTGLRISDILALRWDNVEQYPDGGACLRLKTEKTDTETATWPLHRSIPK